MFIKQKLLKHAMPAFKGHRAGGEEDQSQFGLRNKNVNNIE